MESIEVLNQRLIEHFGSDTASGQAIFRIVWANDETEMKMMGELDSGVQLLFPEIREVKKYPYMRDMYVLERLVVVPDMNIKELAGRKMSYEPVWAYCNEHRQPVPPFWDATKFVVDTLYAALGKKSLRKYVEDEKDTSEEGRQLKITELQTELFGNETDTGDALAYKEGVVVPTTYNKES